MDDILVLDYDDTILPTTYLKEQFSVEELFDDSPPPEMLDNLQDNIIKVLDSLRHFRICILTNSGNRWIPLTCSKMLPRVWEWITEKNIPIYEAKVRYESYYTDPTTWKQYTLRDAMVNISRVGRIFSFGDSEHDMKAVQNMAEEIGCDYRLFPFPVHSSKEELVRHWEFVHTHLREEVL